MVKKTTDVKAEPYPKPGSPDKDDPAKEADRKRRQIEEQQQQQ